MLKKIPKLLFSTSTAEPCFCSKEDGLEGERIPLVKEISKLALELPGKKIKCPQSRLL